MGAPRACLPALNKTPGGNVGQKSATMDRIGGRQDGKTLVQRIDAMTGELLRSHRERSLARHRSRDLMKDYLEVAAASPDLQGVDQYRAVLARQPGLDPSTIEKIIRGAEDSFAIWPVDRPLKFRDVVQYLIVVDCLKAHPAANGVRSRLTTIIAEEVPDEI